MTTKRRAGGQEATEETNKRRHDEGGLREGLSKAVAGLPGWLELERERRRKQLAARGGAAARDSALVAEM